MIYLNRILTNWYLEESVSASVWPETLYLANLISDNFRSINRGHNPRHRIGNDPICLVFQNLLKCRRLWNQKQNAHSHWIRMRENGGSLYFDHLVNKSHGRRELGLLTSSTAVYLWEMMPHTMFWSIQIPCEQQIYWTFPLFRAQIDILFTIFICSL